MDAVTKTPVGVMGVLSASEVLLLHHIVHAYKSTAKSCRLFDYVWVTDM